MKKLNYLFLVGLIGAFFTLFSCNDDDPAVSATDAVKERLSNTWVVDASNSTSMVMYGTETRTDSYDGFTLTVAGSNTGPSGAYTTSAVAELDPWPATGTWSFTDPDAITDPNATNFSLTRGDGLVMNVTLSESVLELNFEYDQNVHAADNDRISEVTGNWTFVLVAQ